MAGFENQVLLCTNVNFDQAAPKPHLGIINAAGKLPIGTGNTFPVPEILAGNLTSPLGTISIGYSSPNITLDVININPSPNQLITVIEDFLSGLTKFTAAGTELDGTATNPGLIQLSPSPLSQEIFANDGVVHSFAMGGGVFKFNTVLDLGTLSDGINRYIAYFGMQNNIPSASPPPDGIYFSYTDNVNAGNWTLNCSNTSVTTSVDSGVPAAIGFVNLGFTVNAAGTSVTFTINGIAVGTIIANIPTISLSPQLLWFPVIGNTPNSTTDLIYLSYLLTTAR